ncbi:hypothetical protein [Shewanella salipaludis]|uniref:Tetratricopeptide repeat protein n=1 Tax=Shewanella salipaludis TaxID=2723052 RepID=A0A972G081_9GAMM|nr:hypothetical protein [Shewanella salipaludis]NMH65116.1 hypothetical protein [Shewanella salipaludis]
MKIIIIFLLVVIGVYLYRRTQRLAREEQQRNIKPEARKTAAEPVESLARPESGEAQPEVEQAAPQTSTTAAVAEISAEPAPEPETETETEVAAAAAPEPAAAVEAAPEPMPEPEPAPDAEPAPEVKAEPAAAAGVDLSWANPQLTQAMSDYEAATSVQLKHQALLGVLGECYKQRKQADYLNFGANLATDYVQVFTELQKQMPGVEQKGQGFMQLATLLNDSGRFDTAIELCQQALQHGLSDGTVTGFEGRIARIEKAKLKAAQ